jgi:hypothetical protein
MDHVRKIHPKDYYIYVYWGAVAYAAIAYIPRFLARRSIEAPPNSMDDPTGLKADQQSRREGD